MITMSINFKEIIKNYSDEDKKILLQSYKSKLTVLSAPSRYDTHLKKIRHATQKTSQEKNTTL